MELKEMRSLSVKLQKDLEAEGIFTEINEVEKPNGERKVGLTVKTGANISPCIYINDIVEEDYEDLLSEVKRRIRLGNKQTPTVDPDYLEGIISYWDKAKNLVTAQVLSTSLNQEYLANKVSIQRGDLSIIFRLSLGSDTFGNNSSIIITKQIAKGYGVEPKEILDAALSNMEQEADLMPINDMLKQMGCPFPLGESLPLYVLSTKNRIHGAALIFSSNIQEEILEKFGSCMVLPASIHEVLLVPENEVNEEAEFFAKMIQSVNEEEVKPEEVLSDHPYFLREVGKLEAA